MGRDQADRAAGRGEERSNRLQPMPPQLPALMYAEAVWKQVGKKRLDVAGQVDGAEIRRLGADLTEEALGRRLFELAVAAQSKGLDPEGRCVARRHG